MAGQPIYVDWAITTVCNLNCRHCVGMEKTQVTREEAVRIARDIIGLSPRWVILEGGEPLLREDLHEIGGMFHKKGIDVFVITNGNAFTEDRLKRLKSFSPKVLFSIDGADPAVYEYTKRGASFEVATRWAKRCADEGIFYGLTAVLSKLNISQVPELIRLTECLGGKRLNVLPLKPFDGDKESSVYYRENALTPEEHSAAIQQVYGSGSKLDIFYDEPFLWNVCGTYGLRMSGADSGITIPEIEGCAASFSLYIQTSGSVRPCMFSPEGLTFGNAAREPLADIWARMSTSDTLTRWANQGNRKGACRECQRFESCRGCLARTTVLLGDPLEADPCCPLAARAVTR